MNVETAELVAVEDASKVSEIQEVLALSFDDMDLVGGGVQIGVTY